MVEDLSQNKEVEKKQSGPVIKPGILLSAEDLVSGSDLVHAVEINTRDIKGMVKVKPVTLKIVQKATKAAGGNTSAVSRYLIKQALVEPAMSDDQIDSIPIGLVNVISNKINEISGISKEMVAEAKNL